MKSRIVPNHSYDSISDWYVRWVDQESWVHPTLSGHLFSMTGDITGSSILDLGCGEGIFSRAMARAGAKVTGVDVSIAMLNYARSRTHADLDVTYLQEDAQSLDAFNDCIFDGAICMLALMDIPDLAGAFRAVRRTVKDDGWLVVAITHPCFAGPHASWSGQGSGSGCVVTTYLSEGQWFSKSVGGLRSQVGAWRRTLSTYLNTAREAGWDIETMLEPPHLTNTGEVMSQGPDIPRLLLARFLCRIR